MVGRRVLVDLRSRGSGQPSRANTRPERPPHVDEAPPGIGLVAPGQHRTQVEPQRPDRLFRPHYLDRGHLVEVLGAEDLGGRKRHAQRDLLHGFAGRLHAGAGRGLALRGQPGRCLRGWPVHRDPRARQQRGQRLISPERVAPEEPEGTLEDVTVLAPGDERAVQGPVELSPGRDVDGRQRPHRRDCVARSDGQSGGTQEAHEMGDVFGEAAGWGGKGSHGMLYLGSRRTVVKEDF